MFTDGSQIVDGNAAWATVKEDGELVGMDSRERYSPTGRGIFPATVVESVRTDEHDTHLHGQPSEYK